MVVIKALLCQEQGCIMELVFTVTLLAEIYYNVDSMLHSTNRKLEGLEVCINHSLPMLQYNCDFSQPKCCSFTEPIT